MKKKLLAAAVVLTAVLMLGGCEGLSAKNAKGPETEESCLYITKDGNLQWVSVETYEGGSYSKEELLDFASEKIKEYNEANGTESSKEPVTLVSGSLEKGKAVLITSYDSGESLVDFASEIGDDTMPFTEIKTGTPELNRLTGAGILAEDKLFATLDPTTRSFTLGDGQQILLTDTVGFINKLPHHLVEAFKSTLEEARYSDIVLHVVDCSNPQMDMHMHVVKETLRELGITDKTIVTVFNKTDRLEESGLPIPRDFSADYQVRISAKNGDGLKELEEILGNIIRSRRVYLEKTYSYSQAGKLQTIRKYGQLLSEEYTEEGIKVTAYVPAELFAGLYGDGSEEKE